MSRNRSFFALACLGGALLAPPAHADIYAYTDGAGVVHYTNVPDDPHYQRIMVEPRAWSGSAPHVARDVQAASREYAPLIDEAARRTRLEPALLRAVIAVESAFDPRAVSKAGAQGLMQLLPATAKRYGVHDAFDPADNVNAGARYLRDLMTRYHSNLELALAAYNAGENAVDRYGRRIPPYAETQSYVPTVLRLYGRFRAPPA